MKAIVLTYAPVTKIEAKLLKETDIFKIATNFSASKLKPNLRLTADNIVQKCLDCDTCNVVSLNYDLELDRVINGCTMPSRHSSLLSCIDYLYFKGYTSVLLVASNPDSATAKINYEGVNNIKDCLNLYKYTKVGNFDIPYKSIKDFIMLTDEEKLLGVKETSQKKLFEKIIFTDAAKYEVHTEGQENFSIESGAIINNILSYEQKQEFLQGASEINCNGLIVKKITQLAPLKEIKEEKPAKKTTKGKAK